MKKYTLTIGIPAHNEEKNIASLLHSIIRQSQGNFDLKKIIIACDNCTDRTVEKIKSVRRLRKVVQILDFKDRKGKAGRLNDIYTRTSTDLLLTLDADIVLGSDNDIEFMVAEMDKNKRVLLVGAKLTPVAQKTFWGKIANISYLSFEDAFLRLNDGKNFYSLVGCATLLRKSLYKSVEYPKSVISDQNYIYATATSKNKGAYALTRKTNILFRTVCTFHDWRVLSSRSVVGDKASVAEHFGKEIMQEYFMPRDIYAASLIRWFIKSPFLSLASVLMNIYIRLFPYKKEVIHDGIWAETQSSKAFISL